MAILQTTGITGSLSISSSRIPLSTSASLFNVNGYNGRLLNVVDSLSGSLFSVNTVAGLPVFEVFSNNRVVAGKFNANDFVISGSRVGIGTSSPGNKLDVRGAVNIGTSGGSSYLFANYNSEILTGVDSSGYYFAVGNGATSNIPIYIGDRASAIIIKTSPSTTAGSEKVRITSAGNVGIGTTSPTQKLSVVSGSALLASTALAGELYFGNDASNQFIYLKRDNSYDLTVAQDASSNNSLYLSSAGNVYVSIDSNDNDTNKAFIVQNNAVKSGTELFRVQENGNVGIGTSSPGAKLHVTSSATTAAGIFQGNVGIGTTSPSALLEIRPRVAATSTPAASLTFSNALDGGHRILFKSSTGNLVAIDGDILSSGAGTDDGVFKVSTAVDGTLSEKMRITNTGNVGIGTTSPASVLTIMAPSGTAFGDLAAANNNLPIYSKVYAGTTSATRNVFYGHVYTANASAYSDLQILLSSTNNSSARAGSFVLTQNGSLAFRNSASEITDADTLAGTEKMRIDTNGNVGIGTTTPVFQTEILGTNQTTANITDAGNKGGMLVVRDLGSAANNGGVLGFSTAIASGSYVQAAIKSLLQNGNGYGRSHLAISLRSAVADTNLTERVRIQSDGNVGIGTTSPSAKLNIVQSGAALPALLISNIDTGTANIYNSFLTLTDNAATATSNATKYNYVGSYVKNVNSTFTSYNVGNYYGYTNINSGSVALVWDFWSRAEIKNKATGSSVSHFVADSGYGGTVLGKGGSRIGFLVNSQNQTAANFDNQYGVFINDLGGATNNYGILSAINSAANKWNIYASGTAQNYFAGSVGIGLTSPVAKLHVQASNGIAATFLSGSDPLTAVANAYIYAPVGTGFSGVPVYRFWYQNCGLGNPASETLAFYTNNSEKVRISSNGNVGIGTTSPSAKLHVSGSVSSNVGIFEGVVGIGLTPTSAVPRLQVYGTSTGNTESRIALYTSNTGTTFNSGLQLAVSTDSSTSLINYSNTALYFGTNGSEKLRIANDGNVGIGTTNPLAKLHVSSSATTTAAIFQGNVGIGSTLPSYRLHVVGDINFSSTVKFGGTSVIYNSATDVYGNFRVLSNQSATSADGMLINYNSTGGNAANIRFYANATTERMCILANGGYVGIGTNTPVSRLHVLSSSLLTTSGANLTIATFASSNSNASFLRINERRFSAGSDWTTASTRIQKTTDVTDQAYIEFNPSGGAYGLAFGTGQAVESMRIIDGGNVGIGTTNPTAKLHVSASRSVTIANFEGGSANWSETSPGLTTGTIHLDPGTAITNYGNAITFGASDNGDGAQAQAGIYIRSSGGYGTKMYFGTTDSYANGAYIRMMISDTGNVGIGTTSPAAQLQVSRSAVIEGIGIGRGGGTILSNTAVGSGALSFNLPGGTLNTAFGRAALYNNLVGNSNSAFGSYAMYNNTTGYANTAVGRQALTNNITGYGNTAVGSLTLLSHTGLVASAFGYNALRNNTTGIANSAFGYNALRNNTSGFNNTAFGNGALIKNATGNRNSAFGVNALFFNTGSNLSAFGFYALNRNTTGTNNNAFGYRALSNNRTGTSNSAFGTNALSASLAGIRNCAFGHNALLNNTTNKNNAFGYQALASNITGFSNNAFGYQALQQNISGYNNSAFGYQALRKSTNGQKNAAFGDKTLYNNLVGTQNNAFGYKSLVNNTTNNNNAFGYLALGSNTTGTANSAFGHRALQANTISSSNSAFGYKALYTNRNTGNSAFGHLALSSNTFGRYNVAIGTNALNNNTIGNSNIAIGASALISNTVNSQNVAVGQQALQNNVTGFNNNAFGHQALLANTTNNNNAFGYRALYKNTTGYKNSAFGQLSLASNTTGNFNSAFGYESLKANTSGVRNDAFGNSALLNNTTGRDNNAFGHYASIFNTSGIQNSAFGTNALRENLIGNRNNAFGYEALKNNTQNNNNAFGYRALASNTAGELNSAFGHRALSANTISGSNSAFGYKALYTNKMDANSAFGSNALVNNTTGRFNSAFGISVLFNNTFGKYNVAVGGQAMFSNTVGGANVAVGLNSMYYNVTGTQNNALGQQSLYLNQTGIQNNAFGYRALRANTTNNNNAFGFFALSSNTTGIRNSAFGHRALNANTISSSNSAFGYKALYTNTGVGNSAFGDNALANNRSGYRNSAFGRDALASNTTGYGNSVFGYRAFLRKTTGINNCAFGAYAMWQSSSFNNCSAFGYGSLKHNTAGACNGFGFRTLYNNAGLNNSAFGDRALQGQGIGFAGGGNNSAFGVRALYTNASGTDNSAFGINTLRTNSGGTRNCAFGSYALTSNTVGNNSNAFGANALRFNTTSANNAFGYQALCTNTTGRRNSAFGHRALASNTIGNQNSAFGYFALSSNTTGNDNNAFGYGALGTLTSGQRNIAIGVDAGDNITTGNSNIIIGHNIDAPIAAGSNQLNIANLIFGSGSAFGQGTQISTGSRVGIGTSSPRARLEVSGSVLDYTSFNRRTSNYTMSLSDASKLIEMNVATANTVNVPTNTQVAFLVGTKVDVAQYGAGQTTITASAGGGVQIRTANNWYKINARYGVASLVKVGTNEWYMFGNLSP